MPPDDSEWGQRLVEERRTGFRKGLNIGLVVVTCLSAVSAAFRAFYDVPRFSDVFEQVKVPMPGLTLLIVNTYPVVSVALLALAVACVIATVRYGERSWTMGLNWTCLAASVAWLLVVNLGTMLPMWSLLDGIGNRR